MKNMSLEEAIEVLDDMKVKIRVPKSAVTQNKRNDALDMAIAKLSASEPEIIRCKECEHRGEEPIADGRYWCDIHDTFMYYCSDVERRAE